MAVGRTHLPYHLIHRFRGVNISASSITGRVLLASPKFSLAVFFYLGSLSRREILGLLPLTLSAFCKEPDIFQAVKVSILRPHQCIVPLRRRVNDAVGQWQPVACAQSCGKQGQRSIKRHNAPLLHDRHILQRNAFAALLRYFFKHFKQCDGRHDE